MADKQDRLKKWCKENEAGRNPQPSGAAVTCVLNITRWWLLFSLLSHVHLFMTPWTAAPQASLSFSISQSLLKLMSIKSVMSSNISSSIVPFSSCLQAFAASGSFPVSWLFASGGQSIGASVSASVLPGQGWFPLGLTGLILLSKGLSRVFSNNSKASVLQHSAFSQLSHPNMTTGKTIALTRQTFIGKIMSLLFNMLARFVIAFLSRSKYLSISWLQSLSTVILEAKKIVCHCFHFFPVCVPWSDRTRCHDLSFLNFEF